MEKNGLTNPRPIAITMQSFKPRALGKLSSQRQCLKGKFANMLIFSLTMFSKLEYMLPLAALFCRIDLSSLTSAQIMRSSIT